MRVRNLILSIGCIALAALLGCGDGHDDEAWAEPTPTPTPGKVCITQARDTSSCYLPATIEAYNFSTTCCDGSAALVVRTPRELPQLCCPADPSLPE